MPNLVLVHWPERQSPEDLQDVARRIEARDPSIRVTIVETKARDRLAALRLAMRPTIGVSFMPVRHFRLLRGRMYQGEDLPKSIQYRRYREAGVPVPDWHEIGPDTALDPGEWGAYVVVKPDLSKKGAGIQIKRTGRVRHKADGEPMLAQKFVYTGRWANHTRVVTLFGRALLQMHVEISHDFRPLESRFAFRGADGVGGAPIVSNKKSSAYSLTDDPATVELGERAHAAFPDIPLLGHDIVRDAETGELFVLESNTRGDVWLFSSGVGRDIQRRNGFDFYPQFDGLERAADALVAQVRRAGL